MPGHSPAHLAYHADGRLFSGDVLFAGSVGRADLPGADWETLLASIRMLADRFPPETVVYPGTAPRRRSARSSPATPSSPTSARSGRGERAWTDRAAPRDARRRARRAAALAARDR